MRQVIAVAVSMGLWGFLMPPAAAQPPAAPVPAAPNQVGISAAVSGRVQITRTGAVGRVVQSGEPIFLGDTITTDATGHLQILLLDETTFTLGPDSAIIIDEFIYDPRTSAGKISAQALKGVFRFVTGRIGRKHPGAMHVKVPAGIIGIRGTMAAGRLNGQEALIVLLGPGERNNTGDRPGSIVVSTQTTGNPVAMEVTISRPGYGTELKGPGIPPTTPVLVPPAVLDALTQALAPPRTPQKAQSAAPAPGEVSASEQAGQETFGALDDLTETLSLTEVSEELEDTSTEAAADAADETTKVASGTATLDQLRTIETGQFHYAVSDANGFSETIDSGGNTLSVPLTGELTVKLNIDFGARTVGGGNSFVTAETSTGGGSISASLHSDLAIPSKSFSSGGGDAVFNYVSSDLGSVDITLDVTLKNSGGTIGKAANLVVTHNAGIGSSEGSGTKNNVERTSGLAP